MGDDIVSVDSVLAQLDFDLFWFGLVWFGFVLVLFCFFVFFGYFSCFSEHVHSVERFRRGPLEARYLVVFYFVLCFSAVGPARKVKSLCTASFRRPGCVFRPRDVPSPPFRQLLSGPCRRMFLRAFSAFHALATAPFCRSSVCACLVE